MSERTTKTVLLIIGMRDNSCRENIANVLGGVAGVTDVGVSLLRARAIVTHTLSCEPAMLIRAVERVGYRAELREDVVRRQESC